ncbi:hypothetical protein CDL12_00806 [Handroanthus impetiginosus]|uniref:Uncharacterized protein n=1 Tax=Handroanthus impetiginosus TaxID=429701 RepID=A0A2G9I9J3_9LAMI|nr:hypothetical protein CDL12_00806 [Handroanthus impetiginosus]
MSIGEECKPCKPHVMLNQVGQRRRFGSKPAVRAIEGWRVTLKIGLQRQRRCYGGKISTAGKDCQQEHRHCADTMNTSFLRWSLAQQQSDSMVIFLHFHPGITS